MSEYQQKRKRESLEFFNLMTWTLTLVQIIGKKEKSRGVNKRTRWLEKLLLCNSQVWSITKNLCQTNMHFQNIKTYIFCTLIYFLKIFDKTTESYVSISQNLCLLKAPPWLGPHGNISNLGCLLCFKWHLKNAFYVKKHSDFRWNLHVSLLWITILFQKAVYLWLLSLSLSLSLSLIES